jgi:serine/threonine protein phosphatase 1
MPRTIAIGDIHGCARALEALLQVVAPQQDDTLIPLGDVIDRGPDSRRVVEQLLQLRDRCHLQPVLGNHEEMMLAAFLKNSIPHTWIHHGGGATLDSYGFVGDLSVIPSEHIEFLRSFVDWVETETHFFVHANYDPNLPLAHQPSRTIRWLSLNLGIPGPHQSGKIAVVGHTPDFSGEIFSLKHIKCLDTYCHGGGWLTAMDVTTGKIWQTNDLGQTRQ